jgi:hypothetical protein
MNKILILSLMTISTLSFAETAKPLGRIVEVHGAGFISYQGTTHELKKGEPVYPNTEIVVEHSGRVTYSDNLDHRFHIGNASSFAVTNSGVELRAGDVWIQSLNKEESYKLSTANAVVEFNNGEAIMTYDSSKGKSQLMVINGLMKFSNLRTLDLNLSVSEGNFSYIDNVYEEGAPRDPTPVGTKTYNAMVGQFKGVSPMQQKVEHVAEVATHEAKREVASVHEVKNEVKPATAHDVALEEYKNSMLEKKSSKHVTKENKIVYSHKSSKKVTVKNNAEVSPLVVHIFGQKKNVSATTHSSTRMPASNVEPVEAVVEKSTTENKIESNSINKQPPAPLKETEKLLEQIKNL